MESNSCELKSQKRDRHLLGATINEMQNFAVHHDKIMLYLEAMLRDCMTLHPSYSCVDYDRDLNTVARRWSCEGLSFATKTLPRFFDSILSYLESGIMVCTGFKIRGGRPVFLQGLTAPLFTKSCEADKVSSLSCLMQFCLAFKKLEGPYRNKVLIEQLDEFQRVDEMLPDFDQAIDSNFINVIVERAKEIVAEVIGDLDPDDLSQSEDFIPRPGPGATNTPTENYERFRPHVDYLTLTNRFPLSEWYSIPHGIRPQSHRWDYRVGSKRVFTDLKRKHAPTSRFAFVPKTYGKPRCICIEQLEMQWMQQAFMKALCKRIEDSPITKGFVNFKKQSVNAALALGASRDLKLSTIDMSAASDRVSRSLVARLFSGTKIVKGLMALSTKTIELPNGVRLATKKYAPMGSALCFPVMSLVHFSLIKSIAEFFSPPWVEIPDVYVYGDDIIVNRELAKLVISHLPLFGMKLNESKSFLNSHFRESCGMNAYYGVDITPTRFKTLVTFPPKNNDLIANLRYEGALFKKGWLTTASVIRHDVLHFKSFGFKKLPKVHSESGLLGWIRDDYDAPASFTKRRWNSESQQMEYSALCVVTITKKPPILSDVDGYLRWLVVRPEHDSRAMGGPLENHQIRRRWITGPDVHKALTPAWRYKAESAGLVNWCASRQK